MLITKLSSSCVLFYVQQGVAEGHPVVNVSVTRSTPQLVLQVGHTPDPVTVTVGVLEHFGLAHGTSSVFMLNMMQSDAEPHGV